MFDFVFEFANDEQRGELDAAIDLISWGLEFETGCRVGNKFTNTQSVGKKH